MTRPPLIRAFQWDLARQVERLDWLLAQLPRYADWGYQELYLHLEDAVAYPSLPAVARRDAYSYRQMARLVAAATKAGLGVVPIVNLLGHTQYLVKVPELRDLNELRQPDGSPCATGQICPLHPRTLAVAEKLLRDMAPFCTTGKVHVGLDESFHLGRHPLSRREIARIGRAAHFARYVQRLHGLASSLNLRMGMWADMLYFLPDAIPLLPPGLIAYDWFYHPFPRLPTVELFNFAPRDLARPLQARGIEYWGCPMNGAFRHEPLPCFTDRLDNIRSWWPRCHAVGAGGLLVTSWESSRLAQETATLVDAAAAGLWLQPGRPSRHTLLATGLRRAFSVRRPEHVAPLLLQADRHPFTGYARWEINKDWALASGPPGLAFYQRELAACVRLDRRLRPAPHALSASAALRLYLAQRDCFVRVSRQAVWQLRRAQARQQPVAVRLQALLQAAARFSREWAEGRVAAERMWLASRRHFTRSPWHAQFAADRRQLTAWQRWLRACLRRPAHVRTANVMCGHWQLFYPVWNFAPAAQEVVAEQLVQGRWQTIKRCHTIEFLARGARRRSAIKHEQSAPLLPFTHAAELVHLRLLVRGHGQVRIGRLRITDGVRILRPLPAGWPTLGRPSPTSGWPEPAPGAAPLAFAFAAR